MLQYDARLLPVATQHKTVYSSQNEAKINLRYTYFETFTFYHGSNWWKKGNSCLHVQL